MPHFFHRLPSPPLRGYAIMENKSETLDFMPAFLLYARLPLFLQLFPPRSCFEPRLHLIMSLFTPPPALPPDHSYFNSAGEVLLFGFHWSLFFSSLFLSDPLSSPLVFISRCHLLVLVSDVTDDKSRLSPFSWSWVLSLHPFLTILAIFISSITYLGRMKLP